MGIDSSRLSSYEFGRVPLPFRIAAKFLSEFRVNPAWLALGEEPVHSSAFISDGFTAGIAEKATFSEVYETVLAPFFTAHQKALRDYTEGAMDAAGVEEFDETTTPIAGHIQPKDVALIVARIVLSMAAKTPFSHYEALYSAISAALSSFAREHQGILESFAKLQKPSALPPLTEDTQKSNSLPVHSPLANLIERVKRAASASGKKAELARLLDVAPARVSEWLAGKKEPGGETTLRLLAWVEQQERQP